MNIPVSRTNREEAVSMDGGAEVEEQPNGAVGPGAGTSPQGGRGRSIARYILYQYIFVCFVYLFIFNIL